MRRMSLMTMTMFMRLLFKFRLDHDVEDMADGYEEMLDLVHGAGYQWVDVTSWEISILSAEKVLDALKRHDLQISSVICLDQFASSDETSFLGRIESVKKTAGLTKQVGCDVLMLVPQAHPGMENETKEQIHQNLCRHFAAIVEFAAPLGLHIVIEDTPDQAFHLCAASDVKAVMDSVPGLELVYDSGNAILVHEDPVAYPHSFAGRIGYVHLKDMRKAPIGSMMVEPDIDSTPMASAPSGMGLIPLTKVVNALEMDGYQGSYCIEFFVDDDRDYSKSLMRTKEYISGLLPF